MFTLQPSLMLESSGGGADTGNGRKKKHSSIVRVAEFCVRDRYPLYLLVFKEKRLETLEAL